MKNKSLTIGILSVLIFITISFIFYFFINSDQEKVDKKENIYQEQKNIDIKNTGGQTISEISPEWSFVINGIEKSGKFTDVYGSYETPITMKIVDPISDAVILQVDNFTNTYTNINELVPEGTEYYLQFFDAKGTSMEPIWPNIKTTK